MINDKEKRDTHPGWGVQFEDGSWLGVAHGLYAGGAFYAHIFSSAEDAEDGAKDFNSEAWHSPLKYQIVPAWEPLCESLRETIHGLRAMNSIHPDDMMELWLNLEGARDMVKSFLESSKK